MTAQASIPLKWYVPFANNDSSRVELPVTTSDPTRASQSLGFPPLTMQPPESGGVPPQGEDFNGGMNQVARICWWLLNGGGFPYDSIFASNSNINGYPNGAVLQSADFLGNWISIADNNQNNPDVSGASWVPGFQYGITSLTGLTGGTVTPTPAQAAKRAITLAGTLASALTIILPNWLKDWTITNNTTGAFVVIVKTAAGSGITIPQDAQPTRVSGDGTNIVQAAENIAAATQPTNALQAGQALGLLLGVQIFTAGGTYTPGVYTVGGRSVTATKAWVKMCGGGGAGGGVQATGAGAAAAACGGNAGTYVEWIGPATTQTITVGAGGVPGAAGFFAGGNGAQTSFGATVTAIGGIGGQPGGAGAPPYINIQQPANGGGLLGASGGGTLIVNQAGQTGGYGLVVSASAPSGGVGGQIGGIGGQSPFGTQTYGAAPASFLYGCGGGGTSISASLAAAAGFPGRQGVVVILEFA